MTLYKIHFNTSSFFFFYFSIVGVWVIFLPKMLQNVGYTPLEIGIVLSIPPLMRFLTPFLFLKLFDLSKKVLHTTLFMMILSIPLLYITIDNFYLFSLSNIFFGISFGLVLPYIETYSLSTLKKELYGRARLWGSIGFALVSLLLAQIFSNDIGLHFIAISTILCALFAYIISLDDIHFNKESDTKREPFSIFRYRYLWLSIFLMQVSFGAFYSFFTIYETSYGISLESISYLWAFGVLCEIILFYYLAYIIKFNLLKLIQFSIFMTIIRWLLLFLFPSSIVILYISQSFHAFSFALYHSAVLSYLYTIYKNRKLAAQFYYGFGFGLGGFVGSLVAGAAYGEYLFLLSSIIAFFAFLSLFILNWSK